MQCHNERVLLVSNIKCCWAVVFIRNEKYTKMGKVIELSGIWTKNLQNWASMAQSIWLERLNSLVLQPCKTWLYAELACVTATPPPKKKNLYAQLSFTFTHYSGIHRPNIDISFFVKCVFVQLCEAVESNMTIPVCYLQFQYLNTFYFYAKKKKTFSAW